MQSKTVLIIVAALITAVLTSVLFSKTLGPGQSLRVSLRLQAVKPGNWTGDVDFCTPAEDFVTSSVTIQVKE